MKNIWVILNEAKDSVIQVFETEDPDSRKHWDLFFQHRAGCAFCGRTSQITGQKTELKWFYNYYYWNDQARWGYDQPDGIGWAAAMTLPEPIKMLVLVGGLHGSDRERD